jgi:hypothetical protein
VAAAYHQAPATALAAPDARAGAVVVPRQTSPDLETHGPTSKWGTVVLPALRAVVGAGPALIASTRELVR